MKNAALALVSVFIFCACHLQRSAAAIAVVPSEAAASEILFLQLSVWKKDTLYGAELRQQKRVAGTLHRDLRGIQGQTGQWSVNFLDRNDQLVAQVPIPNPLEEHYEVSNDQGELRPVDIKKQAADCFIRVQYNPRFSRIRVEEIQTFQRHPVLFSLPL